MKNTSIPRANFQNRKNPKWGFTIISTLMILAVLVVLGVGVIAYQGIRSLTTVTSHLSTLEKEYARAQNCLSKVTNYISGQDLLTTAPIESFNKIKSLCSEAPISEPIKSPLKGEPNDSHSI